MSRVMFSFGTRRPIPPGGCLGLRLLVVRANPAKPIKIVWSNGHATRLEFFGGGFPRGRLQVYEVRPLELG